MRSESTVVVTLPKRSAEPPAPVATASLPVPAGRPAADPATLARQLQTELRRVGCYEGEINGLWTTSTRLAMRAFTERVNAKLPIDKPDQILLSLVQGHQGRVCGEPCSAGQAPGKDGSCRPEAIQARAGQGTAPPPPGEAGPERSAAAVAPVAPIPAPVPRFVGPPALGEAAMERSTSTLAPPAPAAPRLTAPPVEARRAPPPPKPAAAEEAPAKTASTTPPPPPVAAERPSRASRHAGAPIPTIGVYERRVRRFVRRAPPRLARSIVRNLQRVGILP